MAVVRRLGRTLSAWPSYKFHGVEIPSISAQEALDAGYNSQSGQDVLLDRHVFCARRDGVFVDVGAHDGVLLSNSAFFERQRGWRGLCVEPNPNVYEQLVANRTAATENVAIGSREGTMPFLVVSGHAEMLSGLESSFDRRHVTRINRELSVYGGEARTVETKVRRLDDLLVEHAIDHVDLLTIDVEGGELAVLESLSLRRFRVQAVLIENPHRRWKVAAAFRDQGYQLLARISSDEVYVPTDVSLLDSVTG